MNFYTKFRQVSFGLLLIGATCVFSVVFAQQTTEQYIPIGKSPGVSGEYSYIGNIVAVDRSAHTISVEDGDRVRKIRVTDDTRIWLDRSKVRRENRKAAYEDCEVGRMIEVMHTHDDENIAAWIKIESR